MAGNSPSQMTNIPNKHGSKEQVTRASGTATNGGKGAEQESRADAKPTQFTVEQHQKDPDATVETL